MTASMMYEGAESPTALDRHGSHGGPLGGGGQHPSVGSSRTDRHWQLLEALRRRDATAAECLVSTFGDRAYRLAIGITCNHHDAEEVVQDAFWTVIRKIDTFRAHAALGSWIYRITANAALQRRRRGARRRHDISLDEILPAFHEDGRYADPIVDWSTELDDPAVQSELRSALTLALQDLPDHYGAVTILHDVEGLSMAEVADCLDITVATAKSRAYRARLLLRRRLAVFIVGAPSAVEMAS
jgi:RNA polymerase sigma factor (sigma-70 family)